MLNLENEVVVFTILENLHFSFFTKYVEFVWFMIYSFHAFPFLERSKAKHLY